MNKRVKAGAGLAVLLMLAAGAAKAEIYSATFERLSGAAMSMGVSGGSAAGAEAALNGMYSGSTFTGETNVVYTAKPAPAPVAAPALSARKSAAYPELAAAVKAETKEEAKEDPKEEEKPIVLAAFGTLDAEKGNTASFYFWSAFFLLTLVILL